jgi:predicted transcriptional regulator
MKDPEFKKEYNMLAEEFTIAWEIIKLRLAANMTQKQLAEKAGTSQPAIA